MRWLFFLVFTTQLFTSSFSFPLQTDENSLQHTVLSRKEGWNWKLDDLAEEFKGILWDKAFMTDDCTPQQLDRIIFATRASMWMLDLLSTQTNFAYTEAFTRYFGSYDNWLKSGSQYLQVATQLQR